MPIAIVKDISSKFTDVFLVPQFSTNLIYVVQLAYNNCVINFSSYDCVVQVQVMEVPITNGPKVGHLFPLYLLI